MLTVNSQTKYRQSKTESNNAQNKLQKEITALRDSQRTLQLKLRDIEVQNDDFERQTRNTTSSLEDLESKYNSAIERSVMLDEEMRIGEQERENLRIETQRLRDELSDLRIEAEVVQEKLRIAEQTIERHHQSKSSHLHAVENLRPRSPVSDTATSATDLSSPTTASTPPHPKADTSRIDVTPPSPPLSDAYINSKPAPATPMPVRKGSIALDNATTPRPGMYQYNTARPPRHSRGPSISMSAKTGTTGRTTPSIRTTAPAPRQARPSLGGKPTAGSLPRSGSMYKLQGLMSKMQKLEERVYSVRSRLPAPTNTPPRASPRSGSALGHHIPNTVTVRSTRKRPSMASISTAATGPRESGVSRLSFGVASSREPSNSRPSSRASVSSQSGLQRPGSRSGTRPESRGSTRTPLGHYPTSSLSGMEGRLPRPRSSMSGHGHSQSVSISRSLRDADTDTHSDGSNPQATPARRLTMDKSGIPTPSGLPRRQSAGRRTSSSMDGEMGPPPLRPRKMSEIGESY